MRQIKLKAQKAEQEFVRRLEEEAAAMVSIDNYATASAYALERFASEGDERAAAELARRRGW